MRVLMAYASKHGSERAVAEPMAATLQAGGIGADLAAPLAGGGLPAGDADVAARAGSRGRGRLMTAGQKNTSAIGRDLPPGRG